MAIAWPSVLKPQNVGWWLENATRGGGAALNGMEQTVSSGAERWRGSLDIAIRNSEQVLAIRALLARLDGRAGEILVPTFDGRRAGWPLDEWGRLLTPCFVRRRRLDGTPYEDPEIPTISAINAVVSGTTALASTQIAISISQGQRPREGQYFSIVGRLYIITQYVSLAGTIHTVNFRPKLRVAAANGTAVQFARPTGTMKLASEQELVLEGLRFANVSLDLVEAFPVSNFEEPMPDAIILENTDVDDDFILLE